MNAQHACFVRPALFAICVSALAMVAGCGGNSCIGLGSCGGSTVTPNVTLSGTAATGTAIASATVDISCLQGSAAALSDGGGHYTVAFNGTPPCILTVTSGGLSLHSLAFAGGTFNTTPETELMVVYMASQLGTNENGLIAGFPTNAQYQQALANQADVQAAQSAVVTNLQQHYALTLAVPAFLTTSFTVGQPGVDSDLVALAAAGAIDTNGMPDPAAVSLLSAAGLAHPLTASSAPSSGSGGTGSGSGTM